MPAPSSINDFLDLVRKSRQVSDSALEQYLQRCPAGPRISPRRLAVQLVNAGVLTGFQAEQFLLGKYKGFHIGGYRVIGRLGMGGSGLVYLAEHEVMRKRVALKVLPPQFARDPEVLERFRREARAAAALDHPNVVRVHDFRQDGTIHYIVMEYVEGPTLQQLLKRRGKLDVFTACEYTRQTALALHHAHTQGLVHRDIKPGNLIVDATGSVKILDLGLARFESEPEPVSGSRNSGSQVLGTADYLAPEQALDLETVDGRSDIYSLGATLYALLTGHPPFPDCSIAAKLMHHQRVTPRPVHEIRPEVSQEISQLVAKMLAKNPEDRPQSAALVAMELQRWSALSASAALQPSAQTMQDVRRPLPGSLGNWGPPGETPGSATNTVMASADDTISLATPQIRTATSPSFSLPEMEPVVPTAAPAPSPPKPRSFVALAMAGLAVVIAAAAAALSVLSR